MKNTVILALMISMGLVACSTNTQKENTTLGVASGAVVGGLAGSLIGAGTGQAVAIGVGIVGGALLGGYIGHSMDSTDNTNMNHAMTNPTNKSTTWTNKKSGNTYTMAPTSKMMAYHGNQHCRKYHTSAIMGGETKQVYGVACRQADGTWKSMQS